MRGDPIRRRPKPKQYSSPRYVNDEPLTPGLRQEQKDIEAVGFVHDFAMESETDV